MIFFFVLGCQGKTHRQDSNSKNLNSRKATNEGQFNYSNLKLVATIEGFQLPETVVFDSKRNAYYVSSMGKHPTDPDNDGFVSRIDATEFSVVHRFLKGDNNHRLHGPKGIAMWNDNLLIVDVETVRVFDLERNEQIIARELKSNGAIALNDVAINDDLICLTDPKLLFDAEMQSRQIGDTTLMFLDQNLKLKDIVECPKGFQPNGVQWHNKQKSFLVAPLKGGLLAFATPNDIQLADIGGKKLDGIEVDSKGNVLFSSLEEGAIKFVKWPSGKPRDILTGLSYPGNFCLDPENKRLLIPLIADHKVVIYEFE